MICYNMPSRRWSSSWTPRLRTNGVDTTVSFHNFKSQNFKLSVSNPKSKYVAYVSVLSQISNCQGLGRKNKHDILKTDRNGASAEVANFHRLGEKGTPWHFWGDRSRLTGVPKKSLCQKTWNLQ